MALLAPRAQAEKFQRVPDRLEPVPDGYRPFLFPEASMKLYTLNGLAVHADEVMVMIIRPNLITPDTVAELYLVNDLMLLQEIHCPVHGRLVDAKSPLLQAVLYL